MMVADMGFMAISFIALIGFFGFFLVLLTLGVKIIWSGFRGVFSLLEPGMPPDQRTIACKHFGCGARNPRGARFCARCGRSTRDGAEKTDIYG